MSEGEVIGLVLLYLGARWLNALCEDDRKGGRR